MHLSLLKTKIHRATVTHSELNYEGSIAIDDNLLAATGIREFEQVHIWDVTNGARFSTYAIRAEAGSGVVSPTVAPRATCRSVTSSSSPRSPA